MSKHTYRILVDLDDFPEGGDDDEEGGVFGEVYTAADNFGITDSGDLVLASGGDNCLAVASGCWKMVNLLEDPERQLREDLDRHEDHRHMAIRRAEEGVMTPNEGTPTRK